MYVEDDSCDPLIMIGFICEFSSLIIKFIGPGPAHWSCKGPRTLVFNGRDPPHRSCRGPHTHNGLVGRSAHWYCSTPTHPPIPPHIGLAWAPHDLLTPLATFERVRGPLGRWTQLEQIGQIGLSPALSTSKIYLVGDMWNHLNSTPHSFYYISKSVSFIINFNLYISDKLFCTALYTVFKTL